VSCWIIHLSQDTTLFCPMLMVRGKCARLLNFNDVCFIGIEHDIVQINYRFLYSCLYFLSFCLVLQEWKTPLTLTDSSHRKMRCNRVTSFYHGVLLAEMKADVYLMKN